MISGETKEYLLEIIKDIILSGKVESFNSNINWGELETICKKHDIGGLIGNYIGKYAPEKIKKTFIDGYSFSLMRNSLFDLEIEKIRGEFNNKGIPFMILKGNVIKKYYPSPELRSMGDIDILIKREFMGNIEKIMNNLGYEIKNERSDEITFSKGWLINVEMHTQMVSDTHVNINNYYGDGWRYAVLKTDSSYEYEMSKNDFFIFQIVHFAKHYATSGIGIRPIIDIWILLKKWEKDLNWSYINSQLDVLKFRKFADNIFKLIKMWFEDGEKNELITDMERYIFSCGIHGNVMQSSACKEAKAKNLFIYKIKKYIGSVLISRNSMTKIYPILYKVPFLLPYYYVKRFIIKLFNGSAKRFYDREVVFKKEYDIDKLKIHFNELGL